MKNIDCCNCPFWSPYYELCTISDLLDYDEDSFYELCILCDSPIEVKESE